MAAPAATARQTPSGRRLKNGFVCKITLARDPDISMWETADGGVTPSGVEGGEPVNTTTMFNLIRVTKSPPALIEATPGSAVVAYDPAVHSQLEESVNQHTTITWLYPDGTTRAEFGWLRSFVPQPLVRNQMPTANIVIEIANEDSSGAEQAPVTVSVTGT